MNSLRTENKQTVVELPSLSFKEGARTDWPQTPAELLEQLQKALPEKMSILKAAHPAAGLSGEYDAFNSGLNIIEKAGLFANEAVHFLGECSRCDSPTLSARAIDLLKLLGDDELALRELSQSLEAAGGTERIRVAEAYETVSNRIDHGRATRSERPALSSWGSNN